MFHGGPSTFSVVKKKKTLKFKFSDMPKYDKSKRFCKGVETIPTTRDEEWDWPGPTVHFKHDDVQFPRKSKG